MVIEKAAKREVEQLKALWSRTMIRVKIEGELRKRERNRKEKGRKLNEMWFGKGGCSILEGTLVASPTSFEVRIGGRPTKRASLIETHLLSPMTLQLRKEQMTFDPGFAVSVVSAALGTCSSFSTSFGLEHMNG